MMSPEEQSRSRCQSCGQPLPHTSLEKNDRVILSVLIPVHNEGDQIAENLSAICAEVAKASLAAEVIVIDDGSTDDTWQVLRSMVQRVPALKALQLSRNFGKEAAISAGIVHASGQACLVM